MSKASLSSGFFFKKLFLFLGAITLIGILALAWPQGVAAADPPPATVDSGSLNVRSGPGVGYGIVAVVSKGDKLSMLGRNDPGSWVKVRTATNREGWVNATLIFPTVAIRTLPVVPVATLNNTAVVNTGSLNVRAGAGTGYRVLTTAGRGSVVGLLGRNANSSWVKVNPPNGQQGWVNASLLTTTVNLNTLPFMDSPPLGGLDVTTATVTADALNVRAQANGTSNIVTTLKKNDVVSMVARTQNNSWIQIRTSGNVVGWVAGYLIQPSHPFSQLPAVDGGTTGGSGSPPPAGDVKVQGWASVFARSLNVRSGPGTNYTVVGGLVYKDRVNMLGRSSDNNWVKIQFSNGTIGWINSAFVYTSVYVYTLPVVN